jgi:hypothetical protein
MLPKAPNPTSGQTRKMGPDTQNGAWVKPTLHSVEGVFKAGVAIDQAGVGKSG